MKISLPLSWNEIDVNTFIKIRTLSDDLNGIERYIEFMVLLSKDEITIDHILNMEIDVFFKYVNKLSWLNVQPSIEPNQNIEHYKFVDLNTLTLGQFIDLEYYFSEGMFNYLPKICSVFYHDGSTTKERAESFRKQPINDVYGVLIMYLEYRNKILSSYKGFFQSSDVDEADMDLSKMSEAELAEYKAAIAEEELHNKWAWDKVLFKLSNGDITKYDEILGLPLIFVLNQLAFMKECRL